MPIKIRRYNGKVEVTTGERSGILEEKTHSEFLVSRVFWQRQRRKLENKNKT
jgi:hypothetical protein